MTFSFAGAGRPRHGSLLDGVRHIIGQHGYRLNEPKTAFLRPHHRQVVTSVVVNRKPALPRATRRRLRAIRHRLRTGREATLTPAQLEGWQTYQTMIERHREPAGVPTLRCADSRESAAP